MLNPRLSSQMRKRQIESYHPQPLFHVELSLSSQMRKRQIERILDLVEKLVKDGFK